MLSFQSRAQKEATERLFRIDSEREEKRAGNGNRREHRDNDPERKDERKTLDERGTKPKENDARDDVRDVGVADGKPRAGKAVTHRLVGRLPSRKLFFDALSDEDIGIHRKTNGKNEPGDARGREHHRNELEEREHDDDIERERHHRYKARKPIPQNHKQREQEKANHSRRDTRLQRFISERRADGLRVGERDGYRKRTEVEIAHELARLGRREVPGDGRRASGYRLADDWL